MKKSTKGALAAAASASLLLGGAGSLAYWSDNTVVDAGDFRTGNLRLDSSTCVSAPWTVTNDIEKRTGTVNLAAFRAVPGDVLTKTCKVTVLASGINLRAALAITNAAQTVTASPEAVSGSVTPTPLPTDVGVQGTDFTLTPTFKIGTQDVSGGFTVGNADQVVDVVLTVAFPLNASTASNASQYDYLALNDYAVSVTQATTPTATATTTITVP